MKFLLVGHAGVYNRGCEAIIRTTIMMLRQEFKHARITISSFDYVNDKLIDFGKDTKIISARLKETWQPWTWSWALRQICKLYSKEKSLEYEYLPVTKAINKADVVFSVGGDNFSMDYGYPNYYLELNKLVKKRGKKLVIWAASVGPFTNNSKIKDIVANLNLVDLITVRETHTFDYLKQLGITTNIKRVADPAFLLPEEKVDDSVLPFSLARNMLGFNISPILSSYTNYDEAQVIKETTSFLYKIITDNKLSILLIPHVSKPNQVNNDYTFMQKIYENLSDSKMISIVPDNYNAMQLKYIISKCRFFMGSRTHATIAALSSGIPTISIGYSQKSKGINEDIFATQDFRLEANELTAKTLRDRFNAMVIKESEMRKILASKIPEMKQKALLNLHYLKQIL